jgi:hypothetical protein
MKECPKKSGVFTQLLCYIIAKGIDQSKSSVLSLLDN